MYIYRELRNGDLALAAPCKICRKIMQLFEIKEIVYTTDGGGRTKERL
jgi:deoxycytidylate deaminase